ncbi:MAG: FAD-dependent oxidoreductase [Oscillospiraceae bacterium]|nr:FAD-dependent oxidoreductase [Oscillospiraceae bacterium]
MSQIQFSINGIPCTCEEGLTILQAAKENGIEIPNLCNDESVRVYGACGLCAVEVTDDGRGKPVPKLLRACSAKVMPGYVIRFDTNRVLQSRKIALELLMSDHTGDCRGPCQLNCPAGTDCQGYVKKIAQGDFHGAVELIKEKVPLPAAIGRVCPHPCEQNCRRRLVESPISIAFLKAHAADRDLEKDTYRPAVAAETGKKVAVVGGGPAGLTAAYYLRQKGHAVTILDASAKMGGMLRYGIPAYRLPKDVLDREIAEIAQLGVEMKQNVRLGKDVTLEQLRGEYDAVILATGAWSSMNMRVPGEDLEGVVGGIQFLHDISSGEGEIPDLTGKKVAVCGGGNTAMDACRSAIRCGADEVYVIYRRTRGEMPAEDIEIEESMEEGVSYKFLTNPAEIIGENGRVKQMKLQVMELGEPDASGRRSPVAVEGKFEYLDVNLVIMAIGQRLNPEGLDQVTLTRKGTIEADEATYLTNLPNVYAIGDATNRGASIAIEAIGEAGRCAKVVDSALCGEMKAFRAPYYSTKTVTAENLADREKQPRCEMPTRPAEERRKDFAPVNLGFTDEAVQQEAKRCLECGCHDYADCKLIRYANQQEIHPERFDGVKNAAETERRLVCIERNNGKCILCSLCVRVCDEVAKQGILGLVGRGFPTVVKPEFNKPETILVCKDCMKCAEACPTGALRILIDKK